MSDETSSNSESDGALDLSDLNFGPAWARDPSESKSVKKFKDRGDRSDRRDDRRGGGRRDDRRGGGQRENRGGGGFRGKKGGGRGRREDDRRPPRREVEPPKGVSLNLMPAEESLDLLAKRVVESGQTFSVFDLAKVLLQSRDRFRVTFESVEKPLFRCREDQSIWLSRDEALSHLWRGDWVKKYYEEVKVEGEAPKGSFSSVARCGLSKELLGPPNYHGYQERLAGLHRERFSNMPFEAYRAKVQMEHGEEAVEVWLESMKTVTKWKVVEKKEEPEAEEAKEEEVADVAGGETPVAPEGVTLGGETADSPVDQKAVEAPESTNESEATLEEPAAEAPETTEEASANDAPGEQTESEDTPADEPVSEETEAVEESSEPVVLFDDTRAVERHFAENHFDEAFEETNRAWVMGDIRGNLLSPGLLTLLKRTVAEEKRYPAKLMPVVCRQLSGRHVAVFKWKKKLKVGPSRPHAVPADSPLAERPRAIINHLTSHSGIVLKDLWEAVMPDGLTAEQKHEWLQDFQWLLGEGHIILLSDTTVYLAKTPEDAQPPAPKKAEAPKEAKSDEKSAEETPADSDDGASTEEEE